ncbi:MAG: hypothetical protein J0L93_09890 [Deltaproteobacteria bacterium]|nr:hypothetical protein [Deltaproteobacteria bacterium]
MNTKLIKEMKKVVFSTLTLSVVGLIGCGKSESKTETAKTVPATVSTSTVAPSPAIAAAPSLATNLNDMNQQIQQQAIQRDSAMNAFKSAENEKDRAFQSAESEKKLALQKSEQTMGVFQTAVMGMVALESFKAVPQYKQDCAPSTQINSLMRDSTQIFNKAEAKSATVTNPAPSPATSTAKIEKPKAVEAKGKIDPELKGQIESVLKSGSEHKFGSVPMLEERKI